MRGKEDNKKRLNRTVFIYITILLLFNSCGKSPIAKVDGLPIYSEDIKDEKGIQNAYGANYSDEEILLLIFQKKLREYVALNKLGLKITPKMLEKEKERIDKETKAPEILRRVKEYFQGNEKHYLKKYIYPVLASRLLEKTFYFDTTIQREAYTSAQEKFKELKENPDMKIKDDSLYISLDLEEMRNKYDKKFPFFLPFYQMDTLTLKSLPIKGIYPEILEDKLGYYILRKLDKKAKKFDGFFIRKRDFNKWYKGNIKDVKIEIFEPEMKKKVLLRAGNSYIKKLII